MKVSVGPLLIEETLNLTGIFILSHKAHMWRKREFPFTVNDKRCRERFKAPIQRAHRLVTEEDPIIQLVGRHIWLDCRPPVFIHGDAKDFETL